MIQIDVDVAGLDEAIELLETCTQFASAYEGVKLTDVPRRDLSGAHNSDIVEGLAANEKDFFSQPNVKEIAANFTKVLQEEVDRLSALGQKWQRLSVRGRKQMKRWKKFKSKAEANARKTAGKAWRSAMGSYMVQVSDRIQAQTTAQGMKPQFKDGDDGAYAKYKQRMVGFKRPIGVRTGCLLENLNPTESAKNIRLIGTVSGLKRAMATAKDLFGIIGI